MSLKESQREENQEFVAYRIEDEKKEECVAAIG
jgi:hypothetical protein